jgi:uncharacterized protein YndB with AHSA1/START domain
MTERSSSPAQTAATDIVITRVIDAPRELVWKAWTEPEHFMRWWGPRDFTSPECKIDLRVGGRYLNCMRSPEGRDYWTTGVYVEIVEPGRIVYTDSFADERGNPVPATHYGLRADFPLETLVTVILENAGRGRTRMTMTHAGLPAGATHDDTATGWSQSFDKLVESLRP